MQVLRGIAISPGIALGPVVVLDRRDHALLTSARSPRMASTSSWAGWTGARGDLRGGRRGREPDNRDRLGPQHAEILDVTHSRDDRRPDAAP